MKIKNSLIFLLIGFILITVTATALEYPKPVGYVNDYASILTPDQVLKLDNELKDFDNKTTFEIAVVTVKSLGGLNIETYTMGLMNTWGVGKKEKDNGVMLLVAPNERSVRIGTGTGMSQILSDSDTNDIIQNDIIPYFKKGDMSGGTIAGAESIMRHLSGQNAPVGIVNKQSQTISPSPPLSDGDLNAIKVVMFSIIGLLLIGGIGNWTWNKNKIKKENMKLYKNLRDATYNTLLEVYRNAELSLVTLEQNNPSSVWEVLKKSYENIDFSMIGKELDNIQKNIDSLFSSSEVNKKIHSIEEIINGNIDTCNKIESRKQEIIEAKETSNKLINELQEKIESVKEILKHQDVSAKTKGMIDSVNKDFIDSRREVNNSDIDWLQTCSHLKGISSSIDDIKRMAESDIDTVADARIRGPEILRKLPELMDKLERKLSSSGSSKARSMFTDARSKYRESQRLSTGGSADMIDAYLLAIAADNLLQQAESNHVHHVNAESHRNESSHRSNSSSGFGGFGGGGSSGGGSTGRW